MNSFGTLRPRSCLCGHAEVVYCSSKFTCTIVAHRVTLRMQVVKACVHHQG